MNHNDNSNTPSSTNTTKESSMIDLNTILSAALTEAVKPFFNNLLTITEQLTARIDQLDRHRIELQDRIGQLQNTVALDAALTPSPDTSALTESDIEAMVERKVSEMLDDLDVSQAVEEALENLDIDDMVANAVNDTDLSQAVEDALDNINFNEKVDLDDLTEALKSNTDWASMIEAVINSGSFSTTFTR